MGSLKIIQRCPHFAAFAAAVKIFGFIEHVAHDAVAIGLGAGLAKAVVGWGGEIGVFGVARGLVAMRALNHHQLQACGLHSGYKILRVGREREWGVAMGAGGVHGRQPENSVAWFTFSALRVALRHIPLSKSKIWTKEQGCLIGFISGSLKTQKQPEIHFQAAMSGSLFLCRFNLNINAYIFGHAFFDQIVHAPLGAVYGGGEIAATHLGFQHRALITIEFVGSQFHRVGFAQQG